jgi:hypothetical protein
VDRFADLMVKDVNTGECFRLDHLIKAHLEKLVADKKTVQATRDECQDIIVRVITNISIVHVQGHIAEFGISFKHRVLVGLVLPQLNCYSVSLIDSWTSLKRVCFNDAVSARGYIV